MTLQRGYKVGDLSLVYPLARGAGPLFATVGAILLLGERPTPLALAGAVLIVGGVFAMSFTGIRNGVNVRGAVGYGLLTGIFIAGYTLWDKVAVSTLAIPPVLLDTATALVRVEDGVLFADKPYLGFNPTLPYAAEPGDVADMAHHRTEGERDLPRPAVRARCGAQPGRRGAVAVDHERVRDAGAAVAGLGADRGADAVRSRR